MTVERVVFDTLGQMWGTLLINLMTALCSLVGIAGVCIHEKIAIGMVSVYIGKVSHLHSEHILPVY